MNRRLDARLGRLELALAPPADGPICRYHGPYCALGRNWPLDRAVVDPVSVQMDDLIDLIHEGRRKAGLPVEPHPRDVWATDRHERVPEAELRQREQEARELLAEARARNDRMDAAIIAGLDVDLNHQETS